ncbi:hypothetical protein [Allobaculum sp. Allo2]|uniref:hypothetical protein n=1 Tax=Allobaculum sp. Allo2 TaxID=2853432 RepID=UPI001F6045F2|nr:hypothetical protein [Allobaculum sp. Allo2]UNT92818.1 hypothetical protein KWG61_12160 [Allobaculum sp. Allo2]
MQFYTAACLLDPSAGSIVFCKRYIRFCMESVDIETQIKTNTEKSTRLSRSWIRQNRARSAFCPFRPDMEYRLRNACRFGMQRISANELEQY